METVKRQEISINGVSYYLDSLDEESQKSLNEIRIVDNEILRLSVLTNIAGVAKNSLLEKIDSKNSNFEEVKTAEPDYINQ